MTNTFQLGASRKQTTVYHLYLRTYDEANLFGEHADSEVILNAVGQVVAAEWQQTARTFKDIQLDQWRVLPDGLRALVRVESKDSSDALLAYGQVRTSTKPRVLSSFVANFKAGAAKRINLMRSLPGAPVWQQGYHEQRVEDDDTLQRIRGLLTRAAT